MSSLTSYLPPADGFLPKWLLFVRPTKNSPQTTPQTTRILTQTTDLRRLPRQQHPSLLLPHWLPASLRRHHTFTRHSAQRPHLRHLDRPQLHHQTVRRIPHRQPGRVRDHALDVRRGVCALCAGVVGVRDCEAGQGACWAVGGEHCYYYLDGDAVGGVC